MDYNSLVSDLQTYMLRTDTPYVTKIPDFIQQGIIRLYNNAKDIGFEQFLSNINGLTENVNIVNKPNGWKETVSFGIVDSEGNNSFLLERSYEYCVTYSPNGNSTSKPIYYCDLPVTNDSNTGTYDRWGVFPAPNATYAISIVYLALPNFNESNQTNFITIRYPNLLLYSCLIEACLFLDNEEKRTKYETMFNQELETVNRLNSDRFSDRTSIRDKS